MTPRSSATPTRRRTGTRPAPRRQIGADRTAGGKCAEQLLHDKGGIGAEHDHLAMRHVDDAHHAEGDREPDRGEQQHAAEADALEQIGGEPGQPQAVVDRVRAPRRRPARNCGIGFGSCVGTSSSRLLTCGVGSAAADSVADRRQPFVGVGLRRPSAARLCCIAARISGSFSAASAFSSSAAASAEGCRSASCAAASRGGRIGAEQGQPPERRLDRAAQAVVDDDAVEPVRRGGASGSPVAASVSGVPPPATDQRRGRPALAVQAVRRPAPSGPARRARRRAVPSAAIACSLSAKLSPPSRRQRRRTRRRAPARRRRQPSTSADAAERP